MAKMKIKKVSAFGKQFYVITYNGKNRGGYVSATPKNYARLKRIVESKKSEEK